MLLAIDLGNTNVTLGLFEGSELRSTFRIETRRERSADEYAVLMRGLLALEGVALSAVSSAILASVVPPLTDVLCAAVRTTFGCGVLVVGPGVETGISVLVQNCHEVGADRIVNAVAARQLIERQAGQSAERGAIVVDFGTATTLDCVSPRAEYLGGVILPGVLVSLEALYARAAKLHPVELASPGRVVGTSTTQCLQSGIVHGTASMVDGLVDKLRAELEFDCEVVATGGLAHLIADHARSVDRVEPELTLTGLCLIYQRQVAEPGSRPRAAAKPAT